MCGKPTTHTITVSATTGNPAPPTISDDEGNRGNTLTGDRDLTTQVSNGNIVKWVKGGDIASIDSVVYTGGSNLFASGPSQNKDGSWQGVIGNLPSGTEEEYTIRYTVNGATGNPYSQDPKLRMH